MRARHTVASIRPLLPREPVSRAPRAESAHAPGVAQIVPLSGLVEQIRAIVSEHPCR